MSRTIACLASALIFLFALAAMATSAIAAEPTTLSTKLSGESKEAEELTVLAGAKVKDKATLAGKNAPKATGKATYNVYSDKECKAGGQRDAGHRRLHRGPDTDDGRGKVPADGRTLPWKSRRRHPESQTESRIGISQRMSAAATETGEKTVTIGRLNLASYEPLARIKAVFGGQALLVK